jgi:PEP-CTERM motif-containing protein
VPAWHGLRLVLRFMRLSSGPESVAPRRGRKVVLALLILLLIVLPLYLWPLRGGVSGLPGAAALSGPPRDPRDAAAVAHLPADVWEGLLGEGPSGRREGPSRKAPGNLTRITEPEGTGPLDIGAGGISLPPRDDTPSRGHGIGALLGDGADPSDGESGGSGDSRPAPVQFLAGPATVDSPGSGNGWGGGGYSGFPGNLGPFSGGGAPGGPSGPAPTLVSGPSDPSVPTPTPEPTTILLIGSNLALLGAAAWRRLHRREETEPGG